MWPSMTLMIGLPGSSALTGTFDVPVNAELPGRPILRVSAGHISFWRTIMVCFLSGSPGMVWVLPYDSYNYEYSV
jgi:hypothetical protein